MGFRNAIIASCLVLAGLACSALADDLETAANQLNKGQYSEALATYKRASVEGLPAAVRAEAEGGAGLVYLLTGRLPEAEIQFTRSYGRAQSAGLRELAAHSALNLIMVRDRLNHRTAKLVWAQRGSSELSDKLDLQSLSLAETAARYAKAENLPELEVRARVLYARMAAGKDNKDRSLSQLKAAFERAIENGPNSEGLLLIADAAINRGYAEETADYDAIAYKALIQVAGSEDKALRARTSALLGRLYGRAGRLETALSLTGEAELLATDASDTSGQLEYTLQRAVLLEQTSRFSEAEFAYARIVTLVGALRPSVAKTTDLEQRDYLHSLMTQALESRVAYLLRKGASDGSALHEARATLEMSRLVDMEKYYADACVQFGISQEREIEAVDPKAVIVYPILLEDRAVVLASAFDPSTKSVKLHRFERQISRQEVVALAQTLSQSLAKEKTNTEQYLPPARALYDVLVRDVVHALKLEAANTLVFSPNQELRDLPWAALHDGQRFLIESFAVSTTLGLSLVNPKAIDRRAPRVLMAGLKAGDSEFRTLEGVDQEFSLLQPLMPTRTLREEAFTGTRLAQAVESEAPTVLHIASHAYFSPYAAENYIRAYSSRISPTDLKRLVSPAGGTTIDLLVLSACETAKGEPDAVLGMAGSAYLAGAGAVLGALWPLDDKTAPTVMQDFYSGLFKSQLSKAQALRQAQIKRIRAGDAPYLWAPYVLLGNWM